MVMVISVLAFYSDELNLPQAAFIKLKVDPID